MKLHCKLTLLASIGISTSTYAQLPTIGIGVTGAIDELTLQKSFFERQERHYSLLPDLTRRFDNDNLIVQFYHPEVNSTGLEVVNRDASITIPRHLNADTLLETLIKVRAAKTLGAAEISVFSPIPFSQVRLEIPLSAHLHLTHLLEIAGTDVIIEGEVKRSLLPPRIIKHPVTQEDFELGGSNHPELLAQTATLLGKSPQSFASLQAAPETLRGKRIYWMVAAETPINAHFFTALAQAAWMHEQGASVHLITPYLFYSRSDKPEHEVGVTTQGRLIADLIESVGVSGVTVVRAHAPQSLGFFKIHSHEITSRPTIIEFLKKQGVECIVSPDAGFQKDATKFQHELIQAYGGTQDVGLVVMNKERSFEGKERILGGTCLEQVRGKHVVIVDDETASGGTLDQVARILKEYDPKSIQAVVTHLAGQATKALQSPAIQRIVVTNTLPVSITNEKLTVLSIAQEIAQSIARAEANRHP